MPNHSIRTKTSWFDGDASERSTGSTLQVRRSKKVVEPLEEMKEEMGEVNDVSFSDDISLSEAEGSDFFPLMEISAPAKGTDYPTLAEDSLDFTTPTAAETTSFGSVNFENVDLDMSTRLRNEATANILSMEPAKQYRQQNTVPQAVLNQLTALQKAMGDNASKPSSYDMDVILEEPAKQYKEQNDVPNAVLNQFEALEKAMEKKSAKTTLEKAMETGNNLTKLLPSLWK